VLREEIIRNKTQYVTSGFDDGTYYWAVNSIDAHNKSSKENDPPNKFTLVFDSGRTEADSSNIFLKIERVYRLGNYYEIVGKTDPSATVNINDEPVLTKGDGSFKHITSPVPHKGKFIITINAQDRNGNSKTIPYVVEMD
jgi:hypothetical protein